ncbi:MAG: hypothetical protein V4574_08055 [Pseudomonadota bacterium]
MEDARGKSWAMGAYGASAVVSGGIGAALSSTLNAITLPRTDGASSIALPLILAGTAIAIMLGVSIAAYYSRIFDYGAAPAGSRERARFERLHEGLVAEGAIGARYSRLLQETLARVDRFFGDAGQADRSLFPRFLGLREPAPLWTAASYDRCVTIALVYPLAVILFVWAVSGHVGPAEAALGMKAGGSGWLRGLAFGGGVAMTVGIFRVLGNTPWRAVVWGALVMLGGAAVSLAGSGPFVVAFGITLSLFYSKILATIVGNVGAGSLGLVSVIGVISLTGLGDNPWFSQIVIVVLFIVVIGVALVLRRVDRGIGPILAAMTVVILAIALATPIWRVTPEGWSGPVLLIVGLLTLVNAPFDWATLGLTRALLRRGIEKGGWFPLVYGLIDLAVAVVVIALLAVTILWAVQLFDGMTLIGGGRKVLDVPGTLAALGDPHRRAAPEYWWLYAMLFATLVPSIVNVALGALSIVRGVPGVNARIAEQMQKEGVLDVELVWMVPAMVLQLLVCCVVGAAVMLGLLWLIFAWLLPLVGFQLVPMLQALAAADLPGGLLRALGFG